MSMTKEVFEELKASFMAELRHTLLIALNEEIIDPAFILYQDAARDSANFIKKHLHTALLFRGNDPTWRFWSYVLSRAKEKGHFLEFGVFKGESLSFFAQLYPERTFYGFDSFQGHPEDWRGTPSPKGFFSLHGNDLPCADIANIKLVPGWFEDTLPEFIATNMNEGEFCSFIHMDSNLYSSSAYVAKTLLPFISSGTVILFDDFLNYPGYSMHEFKAFFDILAPAFDHEFIAFQHMRAAVLIK